MMGHMDFKRQFCSTHVVVVFVCCSAFLTGTVAEETLPPPGGGRQNQGDQQETTSQQGGTATAQTDGEVGRPGGDTDTQNNSQPTDNSANPIQLDDVTSGSPSSPPEGISSPTPPSVTDGQHSQPLVNQPDGTQRETRQDVVPPGGATEPATPSGEENVKRGDAKLDSASPSSENGEPEVPKTEEKVPVETPQTVDGESGGTVPGDQVQASGDQAGVDTQPQEEPPTQEEEQVEQTGEPAGEKPPEPPEHEPEEKMPSFDEWKQKMLAEQAQQAKQAKQVKMESQAFQPVSGTIAKPKSKSNNRVNYASMSCGAKLIAANTEAKNSGFILTENKDQYMIQPCHAKKWFVVELCEPVAVQSIEIANLELFSSLPESFIVHIGERYPTKEWKTLGTFRARDQRAVQTFPVSDEELFAKYIKVEPLTHYGGEHYCPLTILRVYGTTAVEDYEDSEHVETSVEEDSHELETPESAEDPPNLFTSATDTVINLVKTVLSPGDKETQDGTGKLNGVVQLNGTSRNQSAGNTTVPPPDGEQAAPCTPTVTTGEAAKGKGPPADSSQPQTPTVSDVPPLVTLIESRPHTTASIPSLVIQCNFCQHLSRPTCYAGRSHICGYYRATNFVLGTSCPSTGSRTANEQSLCTKPRQVPKTGKFTGPKTAARPAALKEDEEKGDLKPENTLKKVEGSRDQDNTEPAVIKEAKVLTTADTGTSTPSTTRSHVNIEPSEGIVTEDKKKIIQPTPVHTSTPVATSNGIEKDLIATRTSGTTEEVHTKATTAESSSCDPATTDCSTMGPDVVQIRPTTTEEAMHTEAADQPKEPVPDPTQTASSKLANQGDAMQGSAVQQPTAGGTAGGSPENRTGNGQAPNGKDKVIYAETPSQDYEYDLETIPPPDDGEPIQKLSSGRRETAFMRLKNRIKALELNLNLSSRYLEELSQRYRRQMENMYLSLNKTIQKLSNTSRTAEQRDLRQQSNITELTKRINFLTEQTQRLTDNFNRIHTQVIERHLFLMMIEGIVFLLLVTWLLNRIHAPPGRVRHATPTPAALRAAPPAGPAQTALRPSAQHSKAPDKQKKPAHKVKRRNSIDATPPRPRASIVSKERSRDDIGIRLSGSETGLGSDVFAAVDAASANSEYKEIVNRKKKRKKQNKLPLTSQSSSGSVNSSGSSSQSLGNSSLRNNTTTSSNTRIHRNAGLIFTTKFGPDPSPQNSATSSESGDSGVSPASSGVRHNKAGARRSLDLRDLTRAAGGSGGSIGGGGGSAQGMSRKAHKRQKSEGTIGNHHGGHRSITNIGPKDATSNKVSNGKVSPTENGPQVHSAGWKSWLIGTRR